MATEEKVYIPRFARLEGAHGELVLSTDELGEAAEFWLTDLDGFFGGVGVQAHDVQRKIGHGMLSNPALRTGRTLTLKGYFEFDSDRTRSIADRFVSGVLFDGNLGTLTVSVNGLELSCQVRIDGEIKHVYDGMRAFNLEIPLVAPEPWLYGKPTVYQIFPTGAGTGLKYPLFGVQPKGMLSYGDQPPQGAAISHEGNATAYPTYIVHGEWASGFRLTADGKTLEYPYPVHPNAPVTINCAKGQVLISGQDFTYELSRREWHTAPPRAGFITQIEALAPSTGWCDVIFSDTYI